MFPSKYAMLTMPDGSPFIAYALVLGENLYLVIDLMNDNQVHAITERQRHELLTAGRLT